MEKRAMAKKAKKAKTGFFAGKALCISAKTLESDEGGSAAAAASSAPEQQEAGLSYSAVRALIEKAGGSVSSVTHKRVHVLVATERAVARRTQRVRKALKHKVPIVSVDYLMACDKAQECLPTAGFVLDQIEPEPKAEQHAGATTRAPARELGKPVVVKSVDLGCCCSCHDSGKPDCGFCADHHP